MKEKKKRKTFGTVEKTVLCSKCIYGEGEKNHPAREGKLFFTNVRQELQKHKKTCKTGFERAADREISAMAKTVTEVFIISLKFT